MKGMEQSPITALAIAYSAFDERGKQTGLLKDGAERTKDTRTRFTDEKHLNQPQPFDLACGPKPPPIDLARQNSSATSLSHKRVQFEFATEVGPNYQQLFRLKVALFAYIKTHPELPEHWVEIGRRISENIVVAGEDLGKLKKKGKSNKGGEE